MAPLTNSTKAAIAAMPRRVKHLENMASAFFQPQQHRAGDTHDEIRQPCRNEWIQRTVPAEGRGRRRHQVVDEEQNDCHGDAERAPALTESKRQRNREYDADETRERPRN